MDEIISIIVKAVFAILGVAITTYVIPWLKEKHLYDIVKVAVQAVEKLADTQQIAKADKNINVKKYLASKGVKMTPAINIMIESAVEELDTLKGKIK